MFSCNNPRGIGEPIKYSKINDFMETNKFIQSLGIAEILIATIIILVALCIYAYFDKGSINKKP